MLTFKNHFSSSLEVVCNHTVIKSYYLYNLLNTQKHLESYLCQTVLVSVVLDRTYDLCLNQETLTVSYTDWKFMEFVKYFASQ